jgi:hypothetical protein
LGISDPFPPPPRKNREQKFDSISHTNIDHTDIVRRVIEVVLCVTLYLHCNTAVQCTLAGSTSAGDVVTIK